MPQAQVTCPNCRQPVNVNVLQVFDAGENPAAKQMLLSGSANYIQCPHCHYQGALAMPIVYHDADKGLLLTFVPPELGLPRDEQERAIGALINQVVNHMPQEKRKAYLFSPQAFLTMQTLAERILEADGVTREMIESQQKRTQLLQRLLSLSDSARDDVIKQEEGLIDAEFFVLLGRIGEAAILSNDKQAAVKIGELQDALFSKTEVGRKLFAQTKEVEAARESLLSIGKEITREKLLDLVIQAPNEPRIQALVSYARGGMDYTFFQLLTERIANTRGEEEQRLKHLRSNLLELTRQYDLQIEARLKRAKQNVETIINAEDVEQTMLHNVSIVDDFFMDALSAELEAARKDGNLDKSTKLSKMVEIIQQLSLPPEFALIESLLDAPDEETVRRGLSESKVEITPELLNVLNKMVEEAKVNGDADLINRLQRLQRVASSMSKEVKPQT